MFLPIELYFSAAMCKNKTLLFRFKRQKKCLASILFVLLAMNCWSQELPLGYREYFRHNCSDAGLFNDLNTEDSLSWLIVREDPVNCLRIKPQDTLRSSFPESRAILDQRIWGDYIIRFEFRQVLQESADSAGFVFISLARDADTFYGISFSHDSVRFCYIDGAQPKWIKGAHLPGLQEDWNTVIIRRDILTRSFTITCNGAEGQVVFTDRELVMGYLGFGSHLSVSYLRNLVVWAPTVIDEHSFDW